MPTSSATLRDYRDALTTRGALGPVLTSVLGRLPITMLSLALLLYVRQTTGSFAVAGVVSAGTLVGVSLGSVVQGRVIDRLGPTRPLLLASAVFAVAAGSLVWAIEARAAVALLVGLAVATGLSEPALQGSSRALWSVLLPAGPRREAAYSYEAISFEIFFILGPSLAAFLAATPWAGTGLALATATMTLGAVGFALSPAVRGHRVAPHDSATGPAVGLWGALAGPGMRVVTGAALGFGLVIGCVEVGVPAVAAAAGDPTLGGVLLSAWSVASVLAGVAYAMRPWPRPLHLRLPVLTGGFALLVAAMAATGSIGMLVVAMLAAGALITPQVTAHSLGVELAAPPGAATEGFGWVITAATLGIGVGQTLAGFAVQESGPPAAFLAGGCLGVLAAVTLWRHRAALAPRSAPAPATT